MKYRIYHAINKALMFTLMLAIIGVGGYAIHLTHVHATITVSFGDRTLLQETQLAAIVDQPMMKQFKKAGEK
jgi:hypothetical protein